MTKPLRVESHVLIDTAQGLMRGWSTYCECGWSSQLMRSKQDAVEEHRDHKAAIQAAQKGAKNGR